MTRKVAFCMVVIAVFGAVGLFATSSTEEPSGDVTLTVWDFKYGEVTNSQIPMMEIDQLFMEQHPGVTIDHVGQPNDTYYQLIQAAAAANDGPDVAMFHPGARAWGFGDILIDLRPYVGDVVNQFTDQSIQMVSQDGILGEPITLLPITMQGFGFYYDRDYFRQAGLDPDTPPTTAAEFLTACEQLSAAGIVPIVVGQTYTIDFILRALVANAYGPNVPGLADGSESFNDPRFREIVAFVKTLVDEGYLEPAGFSRPYFMDAIDTYAAGGGGMFAGLLSDVGNWKAFSDGLGTENVGYFPTINFPGGTYTDVQVAQGAGIGYGVMTWSRHQDLAAQYVEFYTTGEGARIFASFTGALSPNTAVTGLEEGYPVLATIQDYLKGTLAADYIQLFYNGYEDDSNRLCDQFFVTGEITIDQFITEYQRLISN